VLHPADFYILVIGAVYYIRTWVLKPIMKLNEITHGLISGDRKTIGLLTNNSAGEVQQLWSSLGALGNKLNEQAEMSEQFQKSSEEDTLTSLLNRRAFEKLAGDIVHRSSESNFAWVMLIDIDHFKSINDTWGHPVGDAVLVAFATMLKNVCRGEDVVARIGGEELAVVFENGDTNAALKYAFRLLEQIRSLEITVQANETLRLTASFGIASGYQKNLPNLLSEADLELYKAKNNGRDRICYQSARAINED
jgi:diguanylate cyclase (GGDEF)-like protein